MNMTARETAAGQLRRRCISNMGVVASHFVTLISFPIAKALKVVLCLIRIFGDFIIKCGLSVRRIYSIKRELVKIFLKSLRNCL